MKLETIIKELADIIKSSNSDEPLDWAYNAENFIEDLAIDNKIGPSVQGLIIHEMDRYDESDDFMNAISSNEFATLYADELASDNEEE